MDFERCLEEEKLIKTKPDKELAELEIREAENDLKSAKEDFERKGWKWATDKAYYSMFHSARALILTKGYKENQSHVCAKEGLNELFIKTGLLPMKFLDYIEQGKKRREDAIYEAKYSENIAETYVDAAEEFLKKAKEIIAGV